MKKRKKKPKREYKRCKACKTFVTRRSRVMRVHKKNCPRPPPTIPCRGHNHYTEIARKICRGD